MSQESEVRIVLGSKRNAVTSNKDVQIQVPLFGDRNSYTENDRNILINLQERFNEERQKSDTFRLSGKIINIFDNTLSGKTDYVPFKNNLYYLNPEESITTNVWKGYPQYSEFTFGRTEGIQGHIPFVAKSANTYNWTVYASYAYSSSTAQTMSYTDEIRGVTINNFLCSDGIPFVMKKGKYNGKNVVYVYCGANHNLNEGEWVELSTPINGKKVFKVLGLGDGSYESEEKVFYFFNLKFLNTEVFDGKNGTLKRVINIQNSGETKSRYYVRLHKILTNVNDVNIKKIAFENNPFGVKKKLEYSGLTPNQIQRVSIKEDSQSFSFSFDKDIHINTLVDNNGKPVTELFVTVLNKGYMGWFNNPGIHQTAIDIGWGFNFLKNSIDNWWNRTSVVNKDNSILNGNYQYNGETFYYNKDLKIGNVIKGDFCEYNDIEQKEYVISKLYHKYSFNRQLFLDNSTRTLPAGYCYIPHHSIPVRVFSDYIESFSQGNSSGLPIVGLPNYAWYSEYENNWFWRDIYDYGFVDPENRGLDIPFTNGAHYPFKLITFLQTPIKRTTYVETTQINGAIFDNCE
jgi:hypothetical protein